MLAEGTAVRLSEASRGDEAEKKCYADHELDTFDLELVKFSLSLSLSSGVFN